MNDRYTVNINFPVFGKWVLDHFLIDYDCREEFEELLVCNHIHTVIDVLLSRYLNGSLVLEHHKNDRYHIEIVGEKAIEFKLRYHEMFTNN